jgi:hypothetical protein
MELRGAVASTLRSRWFWLWEAGGAIIYAIPVVTRFAIGSVHLPVLDLLATPWIDHYVPGNLVEKILIGAFFPGGAGAVAGEVLYSNRNGVAIKGRKKYVARLGGALAQTAVWTAFQLWGNLQNMTGPYGGNIFEYPMVYPLNFMLASFSIFTPDVVYFAKSKLKRGYRKLAKKSEISAR